MVKTISIGRIVVQVKMSRDGWEFSDSSGCSHSLWFSAGRSTSKDGTMHGYELVLGPVHLIAGRA